MKIVFMGTSEFALPILEALVFSKKHEVIAVYTAPPKNAGRHMHMIKSPVHILAEKHNLQIFTPTTFKIEENIHTFKSLNHDLTVVAAYGLILKKIILDAAKYGAINVHPSSLPRWRGAAPIQRAIMAGDQTTSICIMQMDEGLDTGDVLLKNDITIPSCTDAGELSNITSIIGGKMVLEVIDLMQNKLLKPEKQSTEGITYAHKIEKSEAKIDWNENADIINFKIRGLSPNPGAFFIHENYLNGNTKTTLIKIKNAILQNDNFEIENLNLEEVKPGDFVKYQSERKYKIGIICGNKKILIPTTVQKEGGKILDWDAFLSGYKTNIKILKNKDVL